MKFSKLALAAAMVVAASGAHAIAVTPSTSASDLANLLIGTGIAIVGTPTLSTATSTGAGTFTSGAASVGFAEGIVLTTGTVACVTGPNSQTGCTGGGTTTTLGFDFTSTTGQVFFQYVFGSEEYNEYVNSQFNDEFNLLLNGVNIAQLPGAAGVVSINNVNCGLNAGYYRNNSGGVNCANLGLDIQYDGLTTVLTASGNTITGTNHFDFTIFDRGDSALDSGVFIKTGSFSGEDPGGNVPEPASIVLTGLALAALGVTSRRRRS